MTMTPLLTEPFLPRARPGGIFATLTSDDGMSTAEYAIGTIAAAAFAAVLYAVVTNNEVVKGLTSLIQRALSVNF